MNELNHKIGDALRAARGPALTATATQGNKAFNDAIRAKAVGGITVEAGNRQEAPGAAETGKDTATDATTQPEPPVKPTAPPPPGNAGHGVGQTGIAKGPDMNGLLRAGRRPGPGAEAYSQTGRFNGVITQRGKNDGI